jgi:chromosome segregation ATPase
MTNALWSLVSIIGGAGWLVSLLQVRMKNRKLNVDSVKVLTETATGLVGKVKAELEETEADAKALRTEVKELTRQLAEAHLLVDDLNQKLTDAQRRADYYESEFRRVTGLKKRGS